MKKYIEMFAFAAVLSLGFTACDVETDEEAGGTAVENMCGNWDVSVNAVDDSGNIVLEDPFGLGNAATVYTYNTTSNSSTQMWIDDQDTFWEYKFLININYDALTFSADNVVYNPDFSADEAEYATVTDGKILQGQGKNLHGMPTDSISFYISFTDDPYSAAYGFTKYHVSGIRHSGFTE